MRSQRRVTALFVALVVAAFPTDASAIIGGTADPPPSSVVGISGQTSSGASGLVCTGTLVAPNIVLTARHCIEEGNPSCTDTFTGVAKYVSISVTTDGGAYTVASTRVPTGTKPCGDDIALLVLSSAVPASDGSPIADVRLTQAVRDEAYSAVGYGWTCPEGGSACSAKGQRLRKDDLAVECIDCRAGTWRGTSDVTCVGDSGGPAFDANKRVLGVTSVGGIGCSTAYYTRLDAHAEWLRDTVKADATSAPPWVTASVDGEPDGGASSTDGGGGTSSGNANANAAGASSDDGGGCVVAPRSRSSRGSDAISALVMLGIVLLTRACRRSTKRVRTTTSSASTTRTTVGRTIRTATTRSSTISRSSS